MLIRCTCIFVVASVSPSLSRFRLDKLYAFICCSIFRFIFYDDKFPCVTIYRRFPSTVAAANCTHDGKNLFAYASGWNLDRFICARFRQFFSLSLVTLVIVIVILCDIVVQNVQNKWIYLWIFCIAGAWAMHRIFLALLGISSLFPVRPNNLIEKKLQ